MRSQENTRFDLLLPAEFEIGPGDIVSVNDCTWGSGGSYSIVFGEPLYQLFANTTQPGRAVPDISLMMGGCPLGTDIDAGACGEPTSADIIFISGWNRPGLPSARLLLGRDGSLSSRSMSSWSRPPLATSTTRSSTTCPS